MDRAFSTVAYQSQLVPTILFRGPDSVSYGVREETSNVTEEWPDDEDQDDEDQRLEAGDLSSPIPTHIK